MLTARRHTRLAVGIALALAACYRWEPADPLGDPTPLVKGPYDVLRVRLRTGDAIKVIKPRIVGDTLIAYYAPRQRDGATSEVRCALRDVNGFDLQRLKPVETTLLVVAIAAPVVGLMVLGSSTSFGKGLGAFPVGSW